MTVHVQPPLDFTLDLSAGRLADVSEALILDLDGFEGPLHLLLELARRQKVDLLQISVSALAEQYLAFVADAKARRFAVAADYLVMAAWLAYLKSRLLLPRPAPAVIGEAPAHELAAALAFRLKKLDAMREAVEALRRRDRLGRDVFARGDPDARTVVSATRLQGDLHALIAAYLAQRKRIADRRYAPERRIDAYPLEHARERLRDLLPGLADWTSLDDVAPDLGAEGPGRASAKASTLAAGLELVRDGAMELRQAACFARLDMRARAVEEVAA